MQASKKFYSVILKMVALFMLGGYFVSNTHAFDMQEAIRNAERGSRDKYTTAMNMPGGNISVPLDQYTDMNATDPKTGLFVFPVLELALSDIKNESEKYDSCAKVMSKEYQNAKDVFQKKELLEKLKPEINKQLTFYKETKNRCFYISNSDASLDSYDFNSQSFPAQAGVDQDGPMGMTFRVFGDTYYPDINVKLSLTNAGLLNKMSLHVPDEKCAKEIEQRRSKGDRICAFVFLYACNATQQDGVNLQINKVKFYWASDKKKNLKDFTVQDFIGEYPKSPTSSEPVKTVKYTNTSNDTPAGKAFLEKIANEPGVKATPSGLLYKVITEGTGAQPKATDRVRVHYTGTFVDGEKFDSSHDRGEPTEFPLNEVTRGWTEGLQLMKEGAKYTLYVPSNLGYGNGRPGIPPNTVLVFEIELLKVLP